MIAPFHIFLEDEEPCGKNIGSSRRKAPHPDALFQFHTDQTLKESLHCNQV